MKYLLMLLLFVSCQKEPETYDFINVRQKYPYEGSYKGELAIYTNGFHYEGKYETYVQITAYNGEQYAIHNMFGDGMAYVNGGSYRMNMTFTDYSDCGKYVIVELQATGIMRGDTLIENGTFVLQRYDKKYNGTWKGVYLNVGAI